MGCDVYDGLRLRGMTFLPMTNDHMNKQNISSKVLRARELALYELEQFIQYITKTDPELRPDQVLVITGFLLRKLPELFERNPELMDQLNDMTTQLKLNH